MRQKNKRKSALLTIFLKQSLNGDISNFNYSCLIACNHYQFFVLNYLLLYKILNPLQLGINFSIQFGVVA